jgi:hypothetical protein
MMNYLSANEISQDAPFDPMALNFDLCVIASGEDIGNLQDDICLILANCCQTRTVDHALSLY